MLGNPENRVPGMYLLASYDIFALLERVILLKAYHHNKIKQNRRNISI
jgi:hypothetical protein